MRRRSYQEAVEELVNKEAQDTDEGVTHMVNKKHVHHNGFVASSEYALVAHKTHKKHQLVEELKNRAGQSVEMNSRSKGLM